MMAAGDSGLSAELSARLKVLDKEQNALRGRTAEVRREISAIYQLQNVNGRCTMKLRHDAAFAALRELGEASPKAIVEVMKANGWIWAQPNPNQAVGAMLNQLCLMSGNSIERVGHGKYRLKTPAVDVELDDGRAERNQ